MGKVRQAVFNEPAVKILLCEILVEHGFELGANALDPARLRALTDHGHDNPLGR